MPIDFAKQEMHKSLLQIARISLLVFKAYESTASDHVDFFLGCLHPVHSTRIMQCKDDGVDKFIINMAKVCFFFTKYRNLKLKQNIP
jgi:hypothetical protein